MNPPTPIPKITRPMEKHPKAPLGLLITGGNADMTRITWPRTANEIETWMVLSRPQNSSATHAPTRGVT